MFICQFRFSQFLLLVLVIGLSSARFELFSQSSGGISHSEDEKIVRSIFDQTLTQGGCYEDLAYLCKVIGHRLSGSESAEKAVQWGKETMEKMGVDTVWLQPVVVPKWVRGDREKAWFTTRQLKGRTEVQVCALGGSVGTGQQGINAGIIEVQALDELENLGRSRIEGKIVFFNRPMDPRHIDTFHAYGGCVDQRSSGASEAAKYGAVGVVVRSMSHAQDDFPHTGGTHYKEGVPKSSAARLAVANKIAVPISSVNCCERIQVFSFISA